MPFFRKMDKVEKVLDVILHFSRSLIPKRPIWYKFSALCILSGVGIFSSPWWTPLLTSLLNITNKSLGAPPSNNPFFFRPELYGGLLILTGLAVFIYFLLFAGEALLLEPFISTSVRQNETFLELATRISTQRNKKLKLENIAPNDIDLPIPPGPVSGRDAARLLRNISAHSEQVGLNNLYIVETSLYIVIGKD